ncbi:MAG: XrtA system polysaccharide chain length determinant [Nitrospirota bacterium]
MQNSQFNMQDYLDILLRRWKLIVISFVVTAVIATLVGFKLPKAYRSSTLILIERQQIPAEYVRRTVDVEIEDRMQTISQQIKSRTLFEKAIKALNLFEKSNVPMDLKIAMLEKNIDIQVRGRNAFILSYTGNDPETVMKVVNMVASLFIEENLRIREQQATGTSEFLENELKLIKEKLETREKAIKEFKTKHVGELPEQLQSNLASLNRFQLELQTITDALRSVEDRGVIIQRQIEDRKKELERMVEANPLQNRLDVMRAELVDLQSRYTDKYPDIPRLKREIKETEEKLKVEMGSRKDEPTARLGTDPLYQNMLNQQRNIEFEIVTLKDRQKTLLEQAKNYQGRVEGIPAREQQLIILSRDYESLRLNYQSMLNRKMEAQLAENLEKRQKGERFRIVDPANLPQVPYWPDKRLILLVALILGAGVGFGLVFLLEFIKSGFRKPQEAEEAIGLPVFATIPDFSLFNKMRKKGFKGFIHNIL